MKVSVYLFAAAKDAAGVDRVELTLNNDNSVGGLRRELLTVAPELQPIHQTLLVAVNNEYASDNQLLQPDDEIACFPPVSGG